MKFRTSGFFGIGVTAITLLCVSSPAMASHVTSAYLDAFTDDSTLFAIVNTGDGSSDCEHSGHSTSAWIDGPGGFSSGSQSGFSHSVGVSAVDGDYFEGGALSFTCGCTGGYTAPDTTQGVRLSTSFYNHTQTFPDACVYGQLACTSGSPSCSEIPLTVTGAPQPCAPYRRVRYVVIGGQCYSAFSTGSSDSTRVCT